MRNIWFPALISGIFLYLTADLCVCLTCLDISGTAFSASLTTAFVLGGIIVILLFIRNRTSLKSQLLSSLLLQLTFFGLFVIDSLIGITRSFVFLAEDNYAGGLIFIVFWLLFTGISVIGFICTAVVRFIRKLIRTK